MVVWRFDVTTTHKHNHNAQPRKSRIAIGCRIRGVIPWILLLAYRLIIHSCKKPRQHFQMERKRYITHARRAGEHMLNSHLTTPHAQAVNGIQLPWTHHLAFTPTLDRHHTTPSPA